VGKLVFQNMNKIIFSSKFIAEHQIAHLFHYKWFDWEDYGNYNKIIETLKENDFKELNLDEINGTVIIDLEADWYFKHYNNNIFTKGMFYFRDPQIPIFTKLLLSEK